MPVSFESVQAVHDQQSFIRFLNQELGWSVDDSRAFEDQTFDWLPDDIGIKKEELRGSSIAQLRPFVEGQPWGIFFFSYTTGDLSITQLRRLLRAFAPLKRKPKGHTTWNPKHLLFVCTPDWKNYTFAHFEGDTAERAKLSSFGWDYRSDFLRTLCEFNLDKLKFPEQRDMFGLDPESWVKQWSSAFDVKPVTKHFYKEYDSVFKKMKLRLAAEFGLSPKLWDKEFDVWTKKEREGDEKLHLFVQNLVNRLMFLKFLEKRRWLDFNPNYLSDLYKKALGRKENFYEKYLQYVFYAGLNHQVEYVLLQDGDARKSAQIFQQEIGVLPFLNGGLFEKDPRDEPITLPNELFADLFALFGKFNFTIAEDTPFDVEVAVNPEMLGKVFEESVIARKEKGAYYTPRNIVSFMCREALKNHLETQCKVQNAKLKIESLVELHDASSLDAPDALEIYKALYSIKVLDPAVGSGAFVVGMMLEIIEVYKAIGKKLEHDHPYIVQNKLAKPSEIYKLKKQIIQNNMYGVDIEEFAVNIARLRFWLSLAVDFPIDFRTREEFLENIHRIDPLPNLFYKIRRGDSLLANYHGVSLEIHGIVESGEVAHQRNQRIKSVIGDVTLSKRDFFDESNSAQKKAKQKTIDSLLKALVVKEIEIDIAFLREESSQHNLFTLTKKEKEAQEETEKEVARLEAVKKELTSGDGLPSDFPIIWDVDFGEVLSEGGFDVVIANPPYVRQEELKDIKEQLALHYECYTGTADLYTYFYERGIRLLKPGGTLAYISSNKFFRAGYGEKLRGYLSQRTDLQSIIDFGDLPVFEAVTYPTVIVSRKKENPSGDITPGAKRNEEPVRARTVASEDELEHFEETFRAEALSLPRGHFTAEAWRIEDRPVVALLEKIKKAGVPLEEFVDGKIYCGIKTGFNEAFVIDDETKKRLIKEDKKSAEVLKPFLRGRDIKRYTIEDPNLWLIYVPWDFVVKKYAAVMKHLEAHKKELAKRPEVKKGIFPWYALSRYASDYVREFENEKIMLQEIAPAGSFAWDDTDSYYSVNTTYIIGNASKYLLGVLNSLLVTHYYGYLSATIQGGFLRFTHQYLAQIPIAKPTDKQRRAIEERVEKILKLKKSGKSTSELEKEIDAIVYEMYGLTEEERGVVEGK